MGWVIQRKTRVIVVEKRDGGAVVDTDDDADAKRERMMEEVEGSTCKQKGRKRNVSASVTQDPRESL